MNEIKVFKENRKLYIVIDDPEASVEKKIMDTLGNAFIDIAGILRPETEMNREEAEKVDSVIQEPADETQSQKNNKPENSAHNESEHKEVSTSAGKKSVDVTSFSPEQAKKYLLRFLKNLEKNKDLIFVPQRILIAYFKARNREDGVEQVKAMTPEQASQVWIEKEMLTKVASFIGYDFHAPAGTGYDGWV